MKTILMLTMLVFGGSANADFILDFEGIGDTATIDNFYNGGTDSVGNAGVDYGVSFSEMIGCVASEVFSDIACRVKNLPSGLTVADFIVDSMANIEGGFQDYFSLHYANIAEPETLIGHRDFLCDEPQTHFCEWYVSESSFIGTARSIVFSTAFGTATVVFDDMTFGRGGMNPNPVPEPSAFALFVLGLMALRYQSGKQSK